MVKLAAGAVVRPDLAGHLRPVLVGCGRNDERVTHCTPWKRIERQRKSIVADLRTCGHRNGFPRGDFHKSKQTVPIASSRLKFSQMCACSRHWFKNIAVICLHIALRAERTSGTWSYSYNPPGSSA